jgi:LacI family transcriptional regulator
MVTMEQIAVRAGVTTATVSNVLNGRMKAQRVDAAKRAARVKRIAQEMGYRLNRAAAATRTGRSGCIGMLNSLDVAFSVRFDSFEQGLGDALVEHNLLLVKDTIRAEAFADPFYVPRLVGESLADGLLINYVFQIPPAIERLIGMHNRPAIWINSKHDRDCVHPDDERAGYVGTRYLLERGHRKVAFATNAFAGKPSDDHYSRIDRIAGYERAMREAGLAPRVWMSSQPDSINARPSAKVRYAHELFDGIGDATAVIHSAGSAQLFVAAAERGLRIPQDLSLISFEHEQGTTSLREVTRLTVPFYEVGRASVRLLQEKIENNNPSLRPRALAYDVIDGPTVRALP